MRHVTLMNLAASHIGIRNGSLNEIPSYRRSHCMPGPAKSLDLLRKNLQSAINKDIDAVIKKYLEVCSANSGVVKIVSFKIFRSSFNQL